MQIEANLLDAGWRLATGVAALAVLAWAAATAPWRAWLERTDRQHVWLGTIALLALVWAMHAGITPGLSFQFLLVTSLALMHGARLALVGLAAVVASQCVLAGGVEPWTAWGANYLCSALVPVAFVATLHRVVRRRLPHNYFVYFFVTVFAGSMLAFVLAALARLALLASNGTLADRQLAGEYWIYLPMMAFGEGFMNGIVMAVAIVFRPDWVATFDDRLYLRRP
jgi:uncharacterized membrane protein